MKERLTNHTPDIYQDPRETFQLFKMPFTNNFIFTNNEIWQEADDIITSLRLR